MQNENGTGIFEGAGAAVGEEVGGAATTGRLAGGGRIAGRSSVKPWASWDGERVEDITGEVG